MKDTAGHAAEFSLLDMLLLTCFIALLLEYICENRTLLDALPLDQIRHMTALTLFQIRDVAFSYRLEHQQYTLHLSLLQPQIFQSYHDAMSITARSEEIILHLPNSANPQLHPLLLQTPYESPTEHLPFTNNLT